MTESEITQRLCASLRKDYHAVVFKIHGHAMQQPGIPDFYLAHPKWSGWIEAKGPSTRVEPLQKTTLSNLKLVGVEAHILRYKDERRYCIEDEYGYPIKYFETKDWKQGAGQLLEILHGIRTGEIMRPIIQG